MKCDHVRNWHEYGCVPTEMDQIANHFQDAQIITIVSGANNFTTASKSQTSHREK